MSNMPATATIPLPKAWPTACAKCVPLWARIGNRASNGTTARSCNKRVENATRPGRVTCSFRSCSNCSTNAVDDKASAPPIIMALTIFIPHRKAMPERTAVVKKTCNEPNPKTYFRMAFSRSNDSSSPMANNRNNTPNSAKNAMFSDRLTSANPAGPISIPAARYPRTELALSRRTRETTRMAALRIISTSCKI